METIVAQWGKPLLLGRRGENRARQVVFDIGAWQRQYGKGSAQLLVERAGDLHPYPAAVSTEDTRAVWVVTSADTAVHGMGGKAELRYLVDDAVVKSGVWDTVVLESLEEPAAAPPEPESSWVDRVLQAGAQAQTAAQTGEKAADGAQAAAQTAQQAAAAAEKATTFPPT